MNILIIGEFSGFAKHLKNGFVALGHRVVITLRSDGWKDFKPTGEDIFYGKKTITLFGSTIRGLGKFLVLRDNYLIQHSLNRLFPDGVDLIVCINYSFLSSNIVQRGVKLKYVEKCVRQGSKLIMSECGASMAGNYNRREWFESIGIHVTKTEDKRYSFLLGKSDVIIPTIYGYYDDLLAYSKVHDFDVSKVHKAIPLPITIDREYTFDSCQNRKIVIFHGIIRPKEKGSAFIEEAMNRIAAEFPDRVECFSKGGMPYDEYEKIFSKVDILIDQTYGNGWGINAILGAMKGKCVLAPCGPENAENMGIPEIPFVQIGPDSEQIYQTLKSLVLNPYKIDDIKKKSRDFAIKYCESSTIAQRYITSVGLK